MSDESNDIGHAYKCCGIPMYPQPYLSHDEIIKGLTEEEISKYTKEDEEFLKKEGLNVR